MAEICQASCYRIRGAETIFGAVPPSSFSVDKLQQASCCRSRVSGTICSALPQPSFSFDKLRQASCCRGRVSGTICGSTPKPSFSTQQANIDMWSVIAENGKIIDEIPKEDAYCKICRCQLQEGIRVFGTACSCRLTRSSSTRRVILSLMHENCAFENLEKKENKSCELCKEDIQYKPVTLSGTTREENPECPSSSKGFMNWHFPKPLKFWSKKGQIDG